LVQGIDADLDNDDFNSTKKSMKATVNIQSDTGDNEDRTEITLESEGRNFSQATTLTDTEIEAL